MNTISRYCIGIDVDKLTFKVCLVALDQAGKQSVKGSRTFMNSAKGFAEFDSWIGKNRKESGADLKLTMEATGVYHENLAWYFHGKGFHINIVLALKAKRYLQSLGLRSKTDKIDAQGLSAMGLQQQLEFWQPISPDFLKLRSLTRQIEALQVTRRSLSNQLEGVTFGAVADPMVARSIKSIIEKVDKEIERLKNQAIKIVNANEFLKQKWALMESIKGLGIHTFATIVAETGGFVLFKNIKQLTCYSGYDVVENQSGNRIGKTRISKKGNTHIRRAMFMPAFTVVKCKEPSFTALYERVYQKTGIKMKGYVAVQRKLLCLMYTLWKTDQPYDPKKKDGHSKKEEPESPLSGKISPTGSSAITGKPRINSSPTVRRATQDGLSGKVSPSSPLSGKTKILEKSHP